MPRLGQIPSTLKAEISAIIRSIGPTAPLRMSREGKAILVRVDDLTYRVEVRADALVVYIPVASGWRLLTQRPRVSMREPA